RRAIAGEVARASTLTAGAVAVSLGPPIRVHAVLACETALGCTDVARSLAAAKQARAGDLGLRLVGFGALLERITIEPEGAMIHARVDVPPEEAAQLVEAAMKLRGFSHPMPPPEPSGSARVPEPTPTPTPTPTP